MVNITKTYNGQAKKEIMHYHNVQRFWNESSGNPNAVATINGITFSRFTASRFLNINGKRVAFLERQDKQKNALREKRILESQELQ